MKRLTFCVLFFIPFLSPAQTIKTFTGDESVFYTQTKQVNQFFRRFNGEEDVKGNKLYSGDNVVRDANARKKYLPMLFDNAGTISEEMKDFFTNQVLSKKSPIYLDFHGNNWFAEVNATFLFNKERKNMILYFRLEQQNLGYKWVLSNVYFDDFKKYFEHNGDTTNNKLFLHPLSHEIDFMNLDKVFREEKNLDYYLEDTYTPDQLALFVYEIKNDNLKFESVNNVKFHFFQVPGWYFEVSWFNRNTYNSGWLISNLLKVSEKEKNILIRNYTHEK